MNSRHVKFLLDGQDNPRLHLNEISATRFKLSHECTAAGLVTADPYIRLTEKGISALVAVEQNFDHWVKHHNG
jgi:hypothetical protein